MSEAPIPSELSDQISTYALMAVIIYTLAQVFEIDRVVEEIKPLLDNLSLAVQVTVLLNLAQSGFTLGFHSIHPAVTEAERKAAYYSAVKALLAVAAFELSRLA